MSASKSLIENLPEEPMIKPFFHEGIIFNSKKNEVTFSPEARAALEQLILEFQDRFIEEPDDSTIPTPTTEVSAATVSKVIETMQNKGKTKKVLKKFTDLALIILLRQKGKWKKNKEAKEEVQKKIKKYVWNLQKFEVPVEYEDAEGKKLIEGLHMTIWPGSTVDSVIDEFNKFLGFQKFFKEKDKKSSKSE